MSNWFSAVEVRHEGGAAIVSPAGRLDAATAPELDAALAAIMDAGTSAIILDLSSVEFMASAGLRSIMICARRMGASGGGFALAGPGGAVAEVLSISGYADLLAIHETVADALAAG